MSWFEDVREFHQAVDQDVRKTPGIPDDFTQGLREKLISEEFQETLEAIECRDLAEIADGLVDLTYVVIGTALAYGIDMRSVWDVVHKANMAKLGGPIRDDGKILKPEDWQPPDIEGAIASGNVLG